MTFPTPKLDNDPTLTLQIFIELVESKSDAFTIECHRIQKAAANLETDEKGRFKVNFAKYDPTSQESRFTTTSVAEAVLVANRIAKEVKHINFKGIVIHIEGNDGHAIVEDIDADKSINTYNGEFVKNMDT